MKSLKIDFLTPTPKSKNSITYTINEKIYIFFFINQILKIFKHMFIFLKKLLSQQIRNLEPFFFTLWVSKFLAGVEITSIDGI